MFSKRSEYAVNAVIFLAGSSSPGHVCRLSEIADACHSPAPFLSKVLQQLVRKGCIASSRGPGGGYFVDSRHRNISLLEVIRAVEEDEPFAACFFSGKYCGKQSTCSVHHVYSEARNLLKDRFAAISLGVVIAKG